MVAQIKNIEDKLFHGLLFVSVQTRLELEVSVEFLLIEMGLTSSLRKRNM